MFCIKYKEGVGKSNCKAEPSFYLSPLSTLRDIDDGETALPPFQQFILRLTLLSPVARDDTVSQRALIFRNVQRYCKKDDFNFLRLAFFSPPFHNLIFLKNGVSLFCNFKLKLLKQCFYNFYKYLQCNYIISIDFR